MLKALDKFDCDEYWVRLLYLYPTTVTDELIETFANSNHICKYIDMPLQHGADNVLKTMRRGITRKRTEALLDKFRKAMPNVVMRTTLLVGHPGEGEKEFEECMDFVKQQEFDRLGVFTILMRKILIKDLWMILRTPQLPRLVVMQSWKFNRKFHTTKNQNSMVKNYVIVDEAFLKEDLDPNDDRFDEEIIDQDGDGYVLSRTEADAPDVDNLVHFSADKSILDKQLVSVKIDEATDYDLYGQLILKVKIHMTFSKVPYGF